MRARRASFGALSTPGSGNAGRRETTENCPDLMGQPVAMSNLAPGPNLPAAPTLATA